MSTKSTIKCGKTWHLFRDVVDNNIYLEVDDLFEIGDEKINRSGEQIIMLSKKECWEMFKDLKEFDFK